MTAIALTTHELRCDGRRQTDNRLCFKPYLPPPGQRYMVVGELRKLAAAAGWTRQRSSAGRKFDRDYCPDHKPAGDLP